MGFYVYLTVQRHRVRLWRIVKRKKEGEKTKGIMAARSWLYSSLRGWFCYWKKSIASLGRFDCIQFKMNFVFFPLNYTFKFFYRHLYVFHPHRGTRIAFFSVFITENMQHGSGSIIQAQCQKAPWYPFQTIVQCVLKLAEQDVFYQTQNSLAFIHFVRPSTVRVI